MHSQPTQRNSPKSALNFSRWSIEMDAALVKFAIEQVDETYIKTGDFSRQSWATIIKQLSEMFPDKTQKFDKSKLLAHFREVLVKDHQVWRDIKLHGVGIVWSETQNCFVIDNNSDTLENFFANQGANKELFERNKKKLSIMKFMFMSNFCFYLAWFDKYLFRFDDTNDLSKIDFKNLNLTIPDLIRSGYNNSRVYSKSHQLKTFLQQQQQQHHHQQQHQPQLSSTNIMPDQFGGGMSNQIQSRLSSNQFNSQLVNQMNNQLSSQLSPQMNSLLSNQISNQFENQLAASQYQLSSQMVNQIGQPISSDISSDLTNQFQYQTFHNSMNNPIIHNPMNSIQPNNQVNSIQSISPSNQVNASPLRPLTTIPNPESSHGGTNIMQLLPTSSQYTPLVSATESSNLGSSSIPTLGSKSRSSSLISTNRIVKPEHSPSFHSSLSLLEGSTISNLELLTTNSSLLTPQQISVKETLERKLIENLLKIKLDKYKKITSVIYQLHQLNLISMEYEIMFSRNYSLKKDFTVINELLLNNDLSFEERAQYFKQFMEFYVSQQENSQSKNKVNTSTSHVSGGNNLSNISTSNANNNSNSNISPNTNSSAVTNSSNNANNNHNKNNNNSNNNNNNVNANTNNTSNNVGGNANNNRNLISLPSINGIHSISSINNLNNSNTHSHNLTHTHSHPHNINSNSNIMSNNINMRNHTTEQ
ncbi:uncharacterized protein ASCRUDRAFT_81530 [Ascoidea rubescens DSM 1968]|uniref:Myb/SANT-like domain-containing protein n=1 Tax=Ascoidea rubescens DSM 1968 TaxID=1344418 RepID=A0A1D2VEM0_9ASCO|nr:hypothetical protein ASCRUDRAFT_81530 [Ascoidea rubescens DSM 1968]ODV60059.1 hypothetical protein ASCRUDRAFT_81530 [Ascoidea rubescens DSM 1968]